MTAHATELAVGSPAPDFVLKDEQGRPVKPSDFRGHPAVLIFYPGDLTPGCTMQLCAVRDDWQKFKDAGIAVVGINHADAESHKKFHRKFAFPFPLLIDPGKKVSAQYGAVKTMFGATIIRRSVIGIGPDGIVRYVRRGLPRNAEIVKAMTKK